MKNDFLLWVTGWVLMSLKRGLCLELKKRRDKFVEKNQRFGYVDLKLLESYGLNWTPFPTNLYVEALTPQCMVFVDGVLGR